MELSDILKIKADFDTKLPADYRHIKPSGGMCGYWAYIYSNLFKQLGFKCRVISLDTDKLKYIHIITRVYINDDSEYVDLDRKVAQICNQDEVSILLTEWEQGIYENMHETPDINIEESIDIGDVTRYSKTPLKGEVLYSLLRYKDEYINSSISSDYRKIRDICDMKEYLKLVRISG